LILLFQKDVTNCRVAVLTAGISPSVLVPLYNC